MNKHKNESSCICIKIKKIKLYNCKMHSKIKKKRSKMKVKSVTKKMVVDLKATKNEILKM